MFNRVLKQKNHSSNKGFNNAVSPHGGITEAEEIKLKARQRLRASKSQGDMKIDIKPLIQTIAANMPTKVDTYVWMETQQKREAQQKRESHLKEDVLNKRESQLGVVAQETVDDLQIANVLQKVDEDVQPVVVVEKNETVAHVTVTEKPKHVSVVAKKSGHKRSAKRDLKRTVLEKFEALAIENPKFKEFLETYPEYLNTLEIDELRATEYSRLDKLGHVYLDYTGGSLYPESLIQKHADILLKGVYGNPHSSNPTSSASTVFEVQVRKDILAFFGADPQEFDVILTNNASGALKLVGESYPFSPSRKLLLTFDAHNSVNGIREFAKRKGSQVVYVPLDLGEVRINKTIMKERLDNCGADKKDSGLVILTGQSNVTGVKTDLSWSRYAKSRGWDVMLDASALAPTTPIDLSKYPIDYMAISFYKMFGYPTGVGCLLMRKEVAGKMQRPWFAGGTVDLVALPQEDFSYSSGHPRFEDGTVNYLSFPAVSLGLAFLRPLQKTLYDRITILSTYLIKEFDSLRHESGARLVTLAGPKTTYLRGGTFSFYFIDAKGSFIPHLLVEAMAKKRGISLRTGCMCNPGAMITSINRIEIVNHIHTGMTIPEFLDAVGEDFTLLMRISIGIATNWEDCDAILSFFREFLDPARYDEMKAEFGDVKVKVLC